MAMQGKDAYILRLNTLAGPAATRAANRVVYVGADMIRAEAFRLISAGSVSGKGHKPSAPGEPPNRDTGNLQAHIEATNPEPLVALVTSSAEYASALEYGTSKMAARPYMRPARDAKEADIRRLFETEIAKVVEGSGR